MTRQIGKGLVKAMTGASLLLGLMGMAARAEVTVLGWPGGPEEAALRKAAEAYNSGASVKDAEKVKLIFFNRDSFFDKLQTDLAAGTKEFDLNLTATYAVGRYAPYMEPLTLPDSAKATFGDKVLATMQFEGKQYGVPTDLSLYELQRVYPTINNVRGYVFADQGVLGNTGTPVKRSQILEQLERGEINVQEATQLLKERSS